VWSVLLIILHRFTSCFWCGPCCSSFYTGSHRFLVWSVLLIILYMFTSVFGVVRVAHHFIHVHIGFWCGPCCSSFYTGSPLVFGVVRVAHHFIQIHIGFWCGPCCSSFYTGSPLVFGVVRVAHHFIQVHIGFWCGPCCSSLYRFTSGFCCGPKLTSSVPWLVPRLKEQMNTNLSHNRNYSSILAILQITSYAIGVYIALLFTCQLHESLIKLYFKQFFIFQLKF
jgi:hypothetical protein